MRELSEYDVMLVGAGLSGLACGIQLQLLGKQTLLVEQATHAGGLCRSVMHQGLSHEVGCNDFGRSIEAQMKALGIDHPFKPVKNRFIFGDQHLDSPFDYAELRTFLHYPTDLIRLLYLMFQADQKAALLTVTHQLHHPVFRNMVHTLLAYFSFRPVEKIDIGFAKRLLGSAYGYDDPRVPVGGSASLIAAMCARYKSLGGELRLNTTFLLAAPRVTGQSSRPITLVDTQTRESSRVQANVVVSSDHGWDQYPAAVKPSLSVAALLASVDARFPLPKDIHSFIFLPSDVEGFLSEHDRGVLSQAFGFHWFQHHPLNPSHPTYALTAYLLWPRDMPYSKAVETTMVEYILHATDRYFPGFRAAIQGNLRFTAPSDYHEAFGIESCLSRRSASETLSLPCYNAAQDLYFIGNALNSPEDQHAGGALDSAKKTVSEVMQKEFAILDTGAIEARIVTQGFSWGRVASTLIISVFGMTAAMSFFSYCRCGSATGIFRDGFSFWYKPTLPSDNPALDGNTDTALLFSNR